MSTLLEGLNTEQLQAVTHASGPLLIVAGAGTGKTTVITRRIAFLLQQKLAQPSEILALTFTDKASGEMEERVDLLAELGNHDFWISTFHSFCQRILEQHGLDIGLANSFRLLDDVGQWILVRKNFEKFNLDYYKPLGSPDRFIETLLKHFSKCKDEMITPEEYLAYAKSLTHTNEEEEVEAKRVLEVANAYAVYQQLLLDNEYLDFGDLINYAIHLFEKRPNILKIYQEKFKYILVDEFQDTNFAQYQLIKLLTGVLGKDGQPVNNLVVVGDDDQSIYKFRGASVSNILKLKEDYKDVTQITLVQNYRTSQAILDLAYNFIQANNPERLETKLKIDKKLIAGNKEIKDKAHIEVLEADDLSSELTCVVNKIIELKEKNPEKSWNEFAILIRANSAAEEIIPRLNSANIPYTFVANKGLFKKKVIADLICYMKLLDNYHESASLFRVMQLPKFTIKPEESSHITQFTHKKTLSLFEALGKLEEIEGISEASQKKISTLLELITKHSEAMMEKTAVELFVHILADLGILEEIQKDTLQNAEDRELIDQFYKKIEFFEEQSDDKSLRAFLDHLDLEVKAGSEGVIKFDPNLGPESLKVMTVHSSKGLEFTYVFLINMVDQRFPTRAKHDSIAIPDALVKDILPEGDAHLQEERRLFYVAVTRAKTNLYLSWAKDYGGAKLKKPSVFLQETNLVPSEKVSLATGKVVFTKKSGPGRKKQVYQNLPTKFSFSDIASFENCPLDYKYKTYLKLPMPGAAPLSFGKTIHKVCQLFTESFMQGQNPTWEQMEEWYKEHWIDEWYKDKEQKEKYRTAGHTMLKQVFDDTYGHKPNIKYIEEGFKLKLGKEYTIVGRIDRADILPDGSLAIVDYKTNESPKTKNKRDVDQLRLYQWAAETELGAKVAMAYYWHLKDNAKIEQKIASPEELIALQASILDSIEKIRDAIKFDKFAQLHKKAKQHNCNYENLV
jgi:DNA helicase-2/ATP-dependent DNA helicase PcrA